MDDGRADEDCRRVHSTQLRFARKRVTIGEGVSFLNVNALRDFQRLQRRSTILDNRGCRLSANTCRSSWREEPELAKGNVGIPLMCHSHLPNFLGHRTVYKNMIRIFNLSSACQA